MVNKSIASPNAFIALEIEEKEEGTHFPPDGGAEKDIDMGADGAGLGEEDGEASLYSPNRMLSLDSIQHSSP